MFNSSIALRRSKDNAEFIPELRRIVSNRHISTAPSSKRRFREGFRFGDGSTWDGDQYDGEIIIMSTMRMDKIHMIENSNQFVCLPGATLFGLERTPQPLGWNPHSVIGSSCIGASVFGRICNNSGGALMHRDPVYTQTTLYAQVDKARQIHLVNQLEIRLD